MICVKDIEGRVAEIEAAGVDCIGVHTGVDLQAAGVTPMDDLKRIKAASKHSLYPLFYICLYFYDYLFFRACSLFTNTLQIFQNLYL